MNYVSKLVLICVAVAIGAFYTGTQYERRKCDEERMVEVIEVQTTQETIRQRVVSNSRSVNACWLCDNWSVAADMSAKTPL